MPLPTALGRLRLRTHNLLPKSKPKPKKAPASSHFHIDTTWISANWRWCKIKPVLRSALAAWISIVIFVIPPVQLWLGKASFLLLISAIFSPPAEPFIIVFQRELIICLFVATAWAWSALGIYFANLARRNTGPRTPEGLPGLVGKEAYAGVYVEAAPSIISALFLIFGTSFFLFIKARQGPGPYAFACVFACICIDISLTTTPLFPTPLYTTPKIILLPILIHSAIALLTSIFFFPSSVSALFMTRLGDVVGKLREGVEGQVGLLESVRGGRGRGEGKEEGEGNGVEEEGEGEIGDWYWRGDEDEEPGRVEKEMLDGSAASSTTASTDKATSSTNPDDQHHLPSNHKQEPDLEAGHNANTESQSKPAPNSNSKPDSASNPTTTHKPESKSTPNPKPTFDALLSSLRATVRSSEGLIAPLSASGRMMKSDLVYGRIGPSDFKTLQSTARRLAVRSDGMALYWGIVERERDGVLGAGGECTGINTPVGSRVASRFATPTRGRSRAGTPAVSRDTSVERGGGRGEETIKMHRFKTDPNHDETERRVAEATPTSKDDEDSKTSAAAHDGQDGRFEAMRSSSQTKVYRRKTHRRDGSKNVRINPYHESYEGSPYPSAPVSGASTPVTPVLHSHPHHTTGTTGLHSRSHSRHIHPHHPHPHQPHHKDHQHQAHHSLLHHHLTQHLTRSLSSIHLPHIPHLHLPHFNHPLATTRVQPSVGVFESTRYLFLEPTIWPKHHGHTNSHTNRHPGHTLPSNSIHPIPMHASTHTHTQSSSARTDIPNLSLARHWTRTTSSLLSSTSINLVRSCSSALTVSETWVRAGGQDGRWAELVLSLPLGGAVRSVLGVGCVVEKRVREAREGRESVRRELLRRKGELEEELRAFREVERHKVLAPYLPILDPDRSSDITEGQDIPPHRYLFHCYVYQNHLIRYAQLVCQFMEEILRIDEQRTKCKLWTPAEGLFEWDTRNKAPEDLDKEDDENPESIPGLQTAWDTQSTAHSKTNLSTATSSRSREDNIHDDDESHDPHEPAYHHDKAYVHADLGMAQDRNPDFLPPQNMVEWTMDAGYRLFTGFGGGNVLFAVKAGALCAILLVPIMLKSTAGFAYDNKFVWAVIMAQLTLARFRGDTVFGLTARVMSTFLGGLVGVIVWYISSGNGTGNPYGLAASGLVCFPFFFYARLYWPGPQMTNIIFFVTVALVIGYSYQDSHQPTPGSPGVGIAVAWRRFVLVTVGVTAAGIVSFLPPSTTIRLYQRTTLATTASEIGAIYCSIVSFANGKREYRDYLSSSYHEGQHMHGGEEDFEEDGKMKEARAKRREKEREKEIIEIVQSLTAIRIKLNRSLVLRTNAVYEFSLRGRWPAKRYNKILQLQLQLAYSLSHLMSTIERFEPAWARAFLVRSHLSDPDFQGDVLAVFSMISTSLRDGTALPQITPCPLINRIHEKEFGLNVIHQNAEEDFGLPRTLTKEVLEDEQYMILCVAYSTLFTVITTLDKLMIATKEVVGEKYHIHGFGLNDLRYTDRMRDYWGNFASGGGVRLGSRTNSVVVGGV